MKTHLTVEDMNKLRDAHESVKGTNEYQKYLMENELKRRLADGKWSNWKFIGWYIPYSADEVKIKKVGEKVYIMCDGAFGDEIERYTVTEEVNELLDIY